MNYLGAIGGEKLHSTCDIDIRKYIDRVATSGTAFLKENNRLPLQAPPNEEDDNEGEAQKEVADGEGEGLEINHGYIIFDMKILTQPEADQKPLGLAWSE